MRSRHVALIGGLVIAVMLLEVAGGGYPLAIEMHARAAPSPVLRIGFLQTIDSLNPYIGINDASYLLYGLIYDYPFAFNQDGQYVPNIITSASCAVSDCSAWNYTVRQGVKWSDGSNLTAADVAFTWNYDSQNLFHLWAYEPYFNQVVQCTGTNKGRCGAVISSTDPWNVTLYFDRPVVSGEDLFGPIVQKAQWSGVSAQAAETTYTNPTPIGTGPFIADPNIYNEWQQNGAVPLHLFRNPNYHPVGTHIGPSNVTDIYLYVYGNANQLALALERGDIQIAQTTTAGLAAVKGQPNIETQAALQAIQEWDEIGISQYYTKNSGLNPARFDQNVRVALAHATNKDYILQTIYDGQGVRGDSQVSPVTPQWWYNPVTGGDNLSFNIALANQILNQSGYTTWSGGSFGKGVREATNTITVSIQPACYQCLDPPNATVSIPAGDRLNFTLAVRPPDEFPEESLVAQYLQTQWAQIGVQITIKTETSENALSTDVYGGNVEMYIWYWSADPDPNYILSMESSWTLDGWNDNYWNNATYNALYLKQLGDQNLTQRITDVKAAEKLFYESGVYIIYIYPYGQWAMRTDLWQGWGNWTAHPYLQMNAYWGANPLFFNLNCPSCSGVSSIKPSAPTPPVISPPGPISAFAGVNLTFTAASSDANTSVRLNFTWDWGDSNTTNVVTSSATPSATAGHTYAAPGTYNVSVRVYDGYNSPIGGTNTVEVDVYSLADAGYLNGSVRDTGGTPISGAQVVATPGNWATSSHASGDYNITLPAGTYSVAADAPLFSANTKSSVTVVAGNTTHENFTLTAYVGWIVGTVVSSSTNTPLAGATILVTSAAGIQKSVATDASGAFNVSVEPGTYTVNASANGYKTASVSGKSVVSGQATVVDLKLTPVSVPAPALSPLVIGAVALVVIVVVAALVAVLLLRWRNKKESEEGKLNLPPKT